MIKTTATGKWPGIIVGGQKVPGDLSVHTEKLEMNAIGQPTKYMVGKHVLEIKFKTHIDLAKWISPGLHLPVKIGGEQAKLLVTDMEWGAESMSLHVRGEIIDFDPMKIAYGMPAIEIVLPGDEPPKIDALYMREDGRPVTQGEGGKIVVFRIGGVLATIELLSETYGSETEDWLTLAGPPVAVTLHKLQAMIRVTFQAPDAPSYGLKYMTEAMTVPDGCSELRITDVKNIVVPGHLRIVFGGGSASVGTFDLKYSPSQFDIAPALFHAPELDDKHYKATTQWQVRDEQGEIVGVFEKAKLAMHNAKKGYVIEHLTEDGELKKTTLV